MISIMLNVTLIQYFSNTYYLLGKEGYVFGIVNLFISLSVCKQHHSKCYEWITVNFLLEGSGVVQGRTD